MSEPTAVGKDSPLFGLLDGFVNIYGGSGKNMSDPNAAKFFKVLALGRRDKQHFTGEELIKLKPFLEHDPASDEITKQMWFSGRQVLLFNAEKLKEYQYSGEHYDYTLFEINMVVKGAKVVRRAVEASG
jgi:hypothetical protein